MRKLILFACVSVLFGCGTEDNGGEHMLPSGPVVSAIPPDGVSLEDPNVMPVTVACGYPDEPCVSVKVCNHQTGKCVVVSNVLIDTGSYGLRLFAGTIQSLNLPRATSGSGTLVECTSYLDNSSDWGPVALADVVLGDEQTTEAIPIQVIDASYPGLPSTCTNPDTSPSNVGFNGILGVGQFVADCGSACVDEADNHNYFSCANGICTGTTLPLNQQVPNPIAYMPVDNNGIAMVLPDLGPSTFARLANGYILLGIGTRPNNQPAAGVVTLMADKDGNFSTMFEGEMYSSAAFIDSGSSGLFFPTPTGVPVCGSGSAFSLFCPSTEVSLSATQIGADGKTSQKVDFQIGNASQELVSNNPNLAFSDLGGAMSGGFDWGLPFFFGRTVYVGLSNDVTTSAPSPLGTGPYWAY